MIRILSTTVAAFGLLVPAMAFQGQAGFNIAFQGSNQLTVPSDTYGAASGQVGSWNRVTEVNGAYDPARLVDVSGNQTNVIARAFGVTWGSRDFPASQGDDELLVDYQLVFSDQNPGQIVIAGLEPGTYHLFVYLYDQYGLFFGGGVQVTPGAYYLPFIQYGGSFNGTFADPGNYAQLQVIVPPGSGVVNLVVDDIRDPAWGEGFGYIQGLQIVPETPLNTAKICDGAVNSTGGPATMNVAGTSAVSNNNLQLTVSGLPPKQVGYFLSGTEAGPGIIPPGAQGTLCIGTSIGRHNRAWEVQSSDAQGNAGKTIDLLNVPQPNGPVTVLAGETWHWQFWYHDDNPTSTSNFSDAYSVLFTE
ncbi:MAG: hypothetical protein KDB61_02220 [Planctomycetes bacterium]|nr:hypothetical protein [Planctomycetota bacterium]